MSVKNTGIRLSQAPTKKHFDEPPWRERVVDLNPWVRDLKEGILDPQFFAARRTACLNLWQQGADAWNRWAYAMLRLRQESINARAWNYSIIDWEIDAKEAERERAEYDQLEDEQYEDEIEENGREHEGYDDETFDENSRREHEKHDAKMLDKDGGRSEYEGDHNDAKILREETEKRREEIEAIKRYFGLFDAVFSNHKFSNGADFRGFIFPGSAFFDGAIFPRAEADFSKTLFHELAEFEEAKFSGDKTSFINAQFLGGAQFRRAKFSCNRADFDAARFEESNDPVYSTGTDFSGAKFSGGSVSFNIARFSSGASFAGAVFTGGASFMGAKFREKVSFANAHFNSVSFARPMSSRDPYVEETKERPWTEFAGDVDFVRAIFDGSVRFDEARFYKTASFTSAQSKVSFSLAGARFDQYPDFIDATFHEAPRLDNVSLPREFPLTAPLKQRWIEWWVQDPDPRPKLRWLFRTRFRVAADRNVHARIRKLRGMASQGKDSENELKLNAHEIRARRFWVDKPWPPGEGAGRFWLGLIFDKLSDFGQSFTRPLLTWLAAIIFFALIYLSPLSGRAIEPFGMTWPMLIRSFDYCHSTATAQHFGAVGEAFALSLRNAVIFDRSEASHRTYVCLYGAETNNVDPIVPLAATLWSILQSTLSIVLIFLFGLGLRNTFRLK
jgi:uncharacterized protein YjbI with pentapeptide repeats